MKRKWKKEDVIKLFEILLERGTNVISSPKFRALLDRDESLFTNQVTREANGNIAYRSVDFEIDGISNDEFWKRIDNTPYQDLIEDNAALAILKMAERFNLIN